MFLAVVVVVALKKDMLFLMCFMFCFNRRGGGACNMVLALSNAQFVFCERDHHTLSIWTSFCYKCVLFSSFESLFPSFHLAQDCACVIEMFVLQMCCSMKIIPCTHILHVWESYCTSYGAVCVCVCVCVWCVCMYMQACMHTSVCPYMPTHLCGSVCACMCVLI